MEMEAEVHLESGKEKRKYFPTCLPIPFSNLVKKEGCCYQNSLYYLVLLAQ